MNTGRIEKKELSVDELVNKLTSMTPTKKIFRDKATRYHELYKLFQSARSLDALLSLLNTLLNEKLYPNKHMIAHLISQFSGYNLPSAVNKIYNDAIKNNIVSVRIYVAMFSAANKNKDMKLVISVYERLINADIDGKETIESKIHTQALSAYGSIDINLAKKHYQQMVDRNIANVLTHNVMINIGGDTNDIDTAILAYNNAINSKCAENICHNAMIKAALTVNRYDIAQIAYENAIQSGYADTITYNTMIDGAGKNGDFHLANAAYQAALKLNKADKITYASMINVAWKNRWIELAHDAYKIAESQGVVSDIMHDSMISAYVEHNMLDRAIHIYKLRGLTPVIKNENGEQKVDLHNLGYGAAYCGLKELIEKDMREKQHFQMPIIYGKGLHSKNTGESEHPVKKSVYDLIEHLKKKYDVYIEESLENSGMAFCTIQPHKLSYTLKTFQPQLQKQTAMSPAAMVFRPRTPPQ